MRSGVARSSASALIGAIGILLPLAGPAAAVSDADFEALAAKVFANPRDLDTTFEYARMAAERNDYEAAIGALERMLFFNPDLPRVRLELGVLYFRMGSYEMAQTYFETARGAPDLPPDAATKIDGFLAEIAKRRAPNQLHVFGFTGLRYQTNANAGPDGLIVQALGHEAELSDKFAREDDWNWFGQVTAVYAHDLGNQRGDTIESRFTGYYAKQFELSDLDLGLAEIEVGPRFAISPTSSLNVYGIAYQSFLAEDPYSTNVGIGASLRAQIGEVGLVEPSLEYRHRFFYQSSPYPNADDQDGDLLSASVGWASSVGGLRLTGRAGYDRNWVADGDFDYYGYDRFSAEIGIPIDVPLPLGTWRIIPTIGGSITLYDEPNPLVSPDVTREDDEYHYGAAFETVLTDHLGLRGQVMQTTTDSSLPNYDTNNFSVFVGVTYRD